MKHIFIYTDASINFKKYLPYRISGVIVCNCNIIDIFFKKYIEHPSGATNKNSIGLLERLAIHQSISYVLNKYSPAKITVFTDAEGEALKWNDYYIKQNLPINIKYVKGHNNRKDATFKYKYNCLADYISKYGVKDWKEWWYNKYFC